MEGLGEGRVLLYEVFLRKEWVEIGRSKMKCG